MQSSLKQKKKYVAVLEMLISTHNTFLYGTPNLCRPMLFVLYLHRITVVGQAICSCSQAAAPIKLVLKQCNL